MKTSAILYVQTLLIIVLSLVLEIELHSSLFTYVFIGR